MDKKALKILFTTYWSSKGWKPDGERITSPDDLRYAKLASVMFDPLRLSHGDIVQRAIEIRSRSDSQVIANAFLASLSTRRLDIRSALGSYAVLQHLPPHEHNEQRSACSVCGEYNSPQEDLDLSILNFERFKWGGVRHEHPNYAMFDLERFEILDPPSPTEADLTIFLRIVRTIESVPPETTAPQLEKFLRHLLPSNKAERDILVNILGYTGVLTIPEHAGFLNGFVRWDERQLPPNRFVDMGYPACWWRGHHGINDAAVRVWFPTLEFESHNHPC
jgi:hypothetical protein